MSGSSDLDCLTTYFILYNTCRIEEDFAQYPDQLEPHLSVIDLVRIQFVILRYFKTHKFISNNCNHLHLYHPLTGCPPVPLHPLHLRLSTLLPSSSAPSSSPEFLASAAFEAEIEEEAAFAEGMAV